jgi:hypothetical protein
LFSLCRDSGPVTADGAFENVTTTCRTVGLSTCPFLVIKHKLLPLGWDQTSAFGLGLFHMLAAPASFRDTGRSGFYWLHASASIGLVLVPIIILFTSLANPDVQNAFRAQPTNLSYELMTFAVGLSMVLASYYPTCSMIQDDTILLSALDSIRIIWPFTHCIINFIIGSFAAGVLWLLLGTTPSVLSAAFLVYKTGPSQAKAHCSISCRLCTSCDCRTTALRAVLIIFGIGLVSAPIPLPWSGPPEPFIRWRDYSVDAELLWRGTFCNFAAHNWLAAADPSGRHRPYVVFMAVQGITHATVMLFDNRIAAARGHLNGNWEHAFEISGFYLLGVLLGSLLLFTPRRGPPQLPPTSSGSTGGECLAADYDDGCHGQELSVTVQITNSLDKLDVSERGPLPAVVNNQ